VDGTLVMLASVVHEVVKYYRRPKLKINEFNIHNIHCRRAVLPSVIRYGAKTATELKMEKVPWVVGDEAVGSVMGRVIER